MIEYATRTRASRWGAPTEPTALSERTTKKLLKPQNTLACAGRLLATLRADLKDPKTTGSVRESLLRTYRVVNETVERESRTILRRATV